MIKSSKLKAVRTLVLLLSSVVPFATGSFAAAADVPTSTAATKATTQDASLDPRQVYHAFLDAINSGRPDEIKPLCAVEDDASKPVLDAFVAFSTATRDLRTAVTAKFGPGAFGSVMPPMQPASIADSMKQSITGDHATLVGSTASSSVPLVRSGGAWKVEVGKLYKPAVATMFVQVYAGRTQMIKAFAQEVAAGKYATAAEAAQALQQQTRGGSNGTGERE